MEKLLKQAKKFISKTGNRPILKAALVNEEYIIATDSYKLIRIKHNQEVNDPYLHHFKTPDIEQEAQYYPDVTDFIPVSSKASFYDCIYLQEWIDAHTEALVIAKHNSECMVIAEHELLKASAIDKDGVVSTYQTSLVSMPPFEKTGYNCKNMLEALKVFKILKERPTFYWFGPLRPMLLASENIEILIVPIRLG